MHLGLTTTGRRLDPRKLLQTAKLAEPERAIRQLQAEGRADRAIDAVIAAVALASMVAASPSSGWWRVGLTAIPTTPLRR